MPPAADARIALAAHTILKVDAGWLSPKSTRWLKEGAGAIPPGYSPASKDPVSRIVTTKAGKIGVVLFPQGAGEHGKPTPAQEEKVLQAGLAMKGKVPLVVGVSPWGINPEKAFLPKAQGVFACLLGGGEGIGFSHSVTAEAPGVLWLRPDAKGRAVNIVEFLEMPAQGSIPQWLEGVTFRANLEYLDDKFPSDPSMIKVIGTPPKKE